MALVTCYDADGLPREKEPVDARECCLYCGFSMTPKKADVAVKIDAGSAQEVRSAASQDARESLKTINAQPGKADGKRPVAEIRDALVVGGIAFDPKMKKADLVAMLEAHGL
jgi:hypothetical protein